MTDYAKILTNARFYGSKSEPIDSVEVISSEAVGDAHLEFVLVHHGEDSDIYQVLINAEGTADVLAGSADYVAAVAAGRVGKLHGRAPISEPISQFRGEQSNTSIIAGSVMVKAFRKLEVGVNPDVELLSRIAHCRNIAPVHGHVTRELEGKDYTLAMIQDLVEGGRDGWKLALEFASAGKSFGDEAFLLGRAVRNVHRALEQEFSTAQADVSVSLTQHLHELAARNSAVAKVADQARAVYESLAAENTTIQRIHGDLHLGQVLRTNEDYILIDFEGEPARPLEQRRLPDSPLRDVAGVLRSIDYAADGDIKWATDASEAFLTGYGVERSPVLEAYVLDKALYEVLYEADHRPTWVEVPLRAVHRILG